MIHPSGIETSDYEKYSPNRHQIANAARLPDAYHYQRKRFPWLALWAIGIPILVFLYWMFSGK